MAIKQARVAVNGYGVIGKRVADAVALQDDMELVGVADWSSGYRSVAVERGYPGYAAARSGAPKWWRPGSRSRRARRAGRGGRPRRRLRTEEGRVREHARYRAARVKTVWQGGERTGWAGYSFVAQVNYAGASAAMRLGSFVQHDRVPRARQALHARGWSKRRAPR